MESRPIFRHPVNNVRLLRQLFIEETYGTDQEWVIYTLKDYDHNGKKSLYKLYMEANDLTEYEFANKYLDGYEHWTMLCECSWFKPHLARWRKELDLKHKAEYLKLIKIQAKNGGRDALQAMKYLVDRGWETKEDKKKVQQAHQDAVKAEADKLLQEHQEVQEQARRLGITVVK